jgi:hypothetical protein
MSFNIVRKIDDHSVIIKGGFCEFEAHLNEAGEIVERQFDAAVYEQIELPERPVNLVITPLPTTDQRIVAGRSALRERFLKAPLSLRKAFAKVMAEVRSALDMGDFELAEALVEAVDLSVLMDPNESELAQGIKTELLGGLAQFKTLE